MVSAGSQSGRGHIGSRRTRPVLRQDQIEQQSTETQEAFSFKLSALFDRTQPHPEYFRVDEFRLDMLFSPRR